MAAGRMTPAEGLSFGLALCIASFYLMAGFVNFLAAFLALAGIVYYVFLYSILLKKATVQNIVIGGVAGAMAPVGMWAAATGSLDVTPWTLFLIIFFWSPPHFWALSLTRRQEYARAEIPMLPVVYGGPAARLTIFLYSVQLVALTLLLPGIGMASSVYLVAAVALGAVFVQMAWGLLRLGGARRAWALYRYSSIYLALIFGAMVIDVLVR